MKLELSNFVQFCGIIVAKLPTPLHLSLCHSEIEWDIVSQIRAFIAPLIALHGVKNGEFGSVVFTARQLC